MLRTRAPTSAAVDTAVEHGLGADGEPAGRAAPSVVAGDLVLPVARPAPRAPPGPATRRCAGLRTWVLAARQAAPPRSAGRRARRRPGLYRCRRTARERHQLAARCPRPPAWPDPCGPGTSGSPHRSGTSRGREQSQREGRPRRSRRPAVAATRSRLLWPCEWHHQRSSTRAAPTVGTDDTTDTWHVGPRGPSAKVTHAFRTSVPRSEPWPVVVAARARTIDSPGRGPAPMLPPRVPTTTAAPACSPRLIPAGAAAAGPARSDSRGDGAAAPPLADRRRHHQHRAHAPSWPTSNDGRTGQKAGARRSTARGRGASAPLRRAAPPSGLGVATGRGGVGGSPATAPSGHAVRKNRGAAAGPAP